MDIPSEAKHYTHIYFSEEIDFDLVFRVLVVVLRVARFLVVFCISTRPI